MDDITVVIPAYRASSTIGRTIKSLELQTDNHFTVQVVEDGYDCSQRLAMYDIVNRPDGLLIDDILLQKNRGVGYARNTGIKAAKTPYIVFLDADDYLLPNAIANFREIIAKEGIFAGGLFVDIVYQGILVTALTILSYIIGNSFEVGHFAMPVGVSEHGMTMAFLTMSMCEIFHSFNLRSQRKSIFSLTGQNKILWAAMIGSLLLTTAVLEVPFLANAFGFTPIGLTEYGIALVLGFLVIPVVEIVKLFQRMSKKH